PLASNHWHRDSEWAEFLGSSGKVEAIAALQRDWRKLPADQRLDIVFSTPRYMENVQSLHDEGTSPTIRLHDSLAQVQAALERLLVAALEDTEQRQGLSTGRDGRFGYIGFSDPRVCDVAGYCLYELAPQKYSFDPFTSLAKRSRD